MTDALTPVRVLVVDDSADLADSLAASVSLFGCDVRTATSGDAAVECIATWMPSVAFIDLSMPGMSGFDVLAKARAHDGGRHMTAIAMTGWSSEDERAIALTAGFDRFLVKPFDLHDLQDLLRGIPE